MLPASQPNKHSNKIQCRYELQISAKVKSNKNLLSFVSCNQTVNQLTSIVYHLWLLKMYQTRIFTIFKNFVKFATFLRILNTEVTKSQAMVLMCMCDVEKQST